MNAGRRRFSRLPVNAPPGSALPARSRTIGPVNIQLLSDLHLESNPHFMARPLPGADLLVLAGDVGSYQNDSLLSSLNIADFGLARFSPLPISQGGAGWPTPVFFLPGNHEYDGLDFDKTHARLRETCQRLGMVWLERESLVWGGVRFVGSTLWTDFDALSTDQARSGEVTLGEQLKARDKAFRAASATCRRWRSALSAAVAEARSRLRPWVWFTDHRLKASRPTASTASDCTMASAEK